MPYRWTEDDLATLQRRSSTQRPAAALSKSTPSPKKPAKYRNVKTVDAKGNVHDSSKEHRRWQDLQLLARSGTIAELRRQVPFALVVEGVLIGRYVADFVYFDGKAAVVEDVKSPPTRKLQLYQWKKRLMLAVHKIEIREI